MRRRSRCWRFPYRISKSTGIWRLNFRSDLMTNPVARAAIQARPTWPPTVPSTTYSVASMNQPAPIAPAAHSDGDAVNWLTSGARDERFLDNIVAEMCIRLQRADSHVKRGSLHVLIHQPQWLGARMMWAAGMREAV